MIRLLLFILFVAIAPIFAEEPADCLRPPPQELTNYKEAYVPQEFLHESFSWEVADVAVLALLLTVASLLSVRHHSKSRFTALAIVGLLYFGLFRGGCICPVGATTNVCIGLAALELIGKMVTLLLLLPLITAFF